jgi:hypothetical protein
MAFVANLFNTYPCLPPMDSEESKKEVEDESLYREETREEQSEMIMIQIVNISLSLGYLCLTNYTTGNPRHQV